MAPICRSALLRLGIPLVAMGCFMPQGRASGQIPDSLSAFTDIPSLDRNVSSIFSLHPLWIGDPFLDLPAFGTEVWVGPISVADRWGRRRPDTPRIRAFPFTLTVGSFTGLSPVPLLATEGGTFAPVPIDPRAGGFSEGVLFVHPGGGGGGYFVRAEVDVQSQALMGNFQNPRGEGKREWGDFDQRYFSAAVGGPISAGRLRWFGAGQVGLFNRPDWGLAFRRSPEALVGVSVDSVRRFERVLNDVHGRDDRGFDEPRLVNLTWSAYARMDWSPRTDLEVAFSGLAGRSREELEFRIDPFALESGFFANKSRFHAFAVEGRWDVTGRLTAGSSVTYRSAEDFAEPFGAFPEVRVENLSAFPGGEVAERTLLAGAVWEAQADTVRDESLGFETRWRLEEEQFEVEVGGRLESVDVRRVVRPGFRGRFEFPSLAALAAGEPDRFQVVRYGPGGGLADFDLQEGAGWIGGRWTPRQDLALSAALRFEGRGYPDAPAGQPEVDEALGISTRSVPSEEIRLSPRIGARWRPPFVPQLQLFGEAGSYVGRVSYQTLSTAYQGREARLEVCDRPAGPIDLREVRGECLGGSPTTLSVAPPRVVFDAGLQAPEWIRTRIGADLELWKWLFGVSWLHGAGQAETVVRDLNLRPVEGRGGSPVERIVPTLGPVYAVTSRAGAREDVVLLRARGSVAGFDVDAAVTWGEREDHASTTFVNPPAIFVTTPVAGNPNELPLATSRLEVANRIGISVGRAFGEAVRLRIFWTDRAGVPFSFTVDGDLNGDGVAGNDLVEVPASGVPVRLLDPTEQAVLDSIIAENECLKEGRGRRLERNACRGPRIHRLDLHAEVDLPFASLTFVADVFNLLNVLGSGSGEIEVPRENVPLLRPAGRDPATGEPVFEVLKAPVFSDPEFGVERPESMWRVQIGLRARIP